MHRRTFVAGALGATVTAAVLGEAAPAVAGGADRTHRDRAERSMAALRRYFSVPDDSGLLRETHPAGGDNPYSYEWPFSQAHVAALDLLGVDGSRAARRRVADFAAGQERYWEDTSSTGVAGYASYAVAPYGDGGDLFYDDNEWVGLAKVQQHLLTGDRAALHRAGQIFDLVVSGWDDDSSHAAPGGVFWAQGPYTDRNTVSNMPGALLGARLAQLTHRADTLRWATRMYGWAREHLLSPDGLYWDHLTLDGTVEKTFWSYNQGIPIAAALILHQATGERRYRDDARAVADAAFGYYVTGGRLTGQPLYFNSMLFKAGLMLENAFGGDRYRAAMADYAGYLWDEVRDPATGLFPTQDDGSTQLLDQAAAVQIDAVLAWPRRQCAKLY
ncbi:MAG: glycoside hydrolase family 76 protein [Actinocatenispora sp.]